MLLVVDIGNSHSTVGVFEGTNLRCRLQMVTRRGWTSDELAADLSRLLALDGIDFDDLRAAVVACVVPPALASVVHALRRYASLEALTVGPGVRTGVTIRYDSPQDVGADRILAAVAVHARHRVPDADGHGWIVVNFGTATTFDVVSGRPEYLGGVISPGVSIGADALFARAALLPRVDVARPRRVVGVNTVTAVQSGLVYGQAALVEGVVRRIRAELSWPVRVVATGDFADPIAAESDVIDVVDPTLVLEGLRLIHERNVPT
ncbi:MAG: type III pantothenate kinase [Myxococcales bacterium FL481]|nr:MAG: type III pantothenate kinase [Myxococcales bacterium FL481]